MRKQSLVKVVSFAVAVLLGLVSAQTPTAAAATPTFGIPAYANPATQAQINQAYTQQFVGGGATGSAPANTAATSVSPAAAGQMQIGQNMASQQAVIGQGFASQYGMSAWGFPAQQPVATAPQSAAVSLVATDAATTAPQANPGTKYWSGNTTQDWATIDWAAQYGGAAAAPGVKQGGAATYGAPGGKNTYGPSATGAGGSSSYTAGNGAAVSLVAAGGTPATPIDPVLAAKIAQAQANYAARQQAMELEEERIELEMELGLMNELSSLQAAHQAAIQIAATNGAPITVTATPVVAQGPVASAPVQNSLTLMSNSQQIPVDTNVIPQPVATAGSSLAPVTAPNEAPVVASVTPVAAPVVVPDPAIATPAPAVITASPVAPVNAAPITPIAAPVTPAPVVAPAQASPVVATPVTPVVAAAAAPVIMTEAQIFAKEQQLFKEIEILKSQRLKNSVTKTLTNYQAILSNQMAEFQLLLDATVSQLKCDAACVSTCAAAALTLDAKALCLDTCLCYATPAVPVTPASPVLTPAAPVVTPVTPVAAPVAPIVADVPVAAEPAVQATPVAEAATPAQTVVASSEPVLAGSQQALFLTEDALVMSANGSLSAIVVLGATLALITLIGSAAFHYNSYGKKGFTLKGMGLVKSKKSENFQDAEEYLLIK